MLRFFNAEFFLLVNNLAVYAHIFCTRADSGRTEKRRRKRMAKAAKKAPAKKAKKAPAKKAAAKKKR